MADETLSPDEKIVVVNIMCTSYSGATWVNLVLGSHPQTFSIGEIDSIVKREQAICSIHRSDCPLWPKVSLNDPENIYLQIARASGKRILIVNKPRRLMDAQDHPQIVRKFIFMTRDGRAVVASNLRKYPHRKTWQACRWWKRSINKKQRQVNSFPKQDVMDIRYESLVEQPEPELQRICAFLDIPYEPAMQDFMEIDHHFIGGSGGVINKLREKVGLEKHPDDKPVKRVNAVLDHKFYENYDAKKFKDERWRSELSDWQLTQFKLIAGSTNKRYGYPAGKG